MLSNSIHQFLRDERGSYTIWSLLWFVIYVLIGGFAVEMTDIYRTQSTLQSTADAAALAGVMSLPDEAVVVPMARLYSQTNMDNNIHGIVLKDEDVKLGQWKDETFIEGASPPNAVYVTTRRAEENDNPLAMTFLRILQLVGADPWWNVKAEAVAVWGPELCKNNGIIAGGVLTMTTDQHFTDYICLHGAEGMKLTNSNIFDWGVTASVGCSKGSKNCLMPTESLAMGNDGFPEAWEAGGGYGEVRAPENAQTAGDYFDALIDLATNSKYQTDGGFDAFLSDYNEGDLSYEGWKYFADANGGSGPEYYSGTDLPAGAVAPLGTEPVNPKPTVYHLDCGGNGGNSAFSLPAGVYRNMAIITNCPVDKSSSTEVDMRNVVLMVDWWKGANPTTQFGMHFAGKAVLGATECGEGGVELITRNSSIHFAAGGQINNSRILSGWNIKFAASGLGEIGVHMEAVNDIDLTQGGNFGLCPVPADSVPQHMVYALVR